jgi:CubicO group peptidase (beta-lactamase class C family)
MSSKLFVLLCTISFPVLSWCQDLGQWTDSFVKSIGPAKHFRGTIVVERSCQTLVEKSYGAAVEEWQIPNSADTKFEIASLSKQFTAAAILQLADAGKLKVEDPVSKYYPDSPPAWKGMTIHHLLTHTSGLPENEWGNFYKGKCTPYTTDEQVKTFRDRPLGLSARHLMEIQEHGVLPARVHHREAFWRAVRFVSGSSYFRTLEDDSFRVRNDGSHRAPNGRGIFT